MRTHPGRSITVVLALFMASLVTFAAIAQVRGKGRLQGSVVDKATGKPVAGATVTISGNNTKPAVTKTNAKGQWSVLGLISGTWSIDIEAKGYQTLRGSASLSEMQMVPPIRSELAAEVVEAEVPVESTISNVPENVISAVNEAQELLSRSAGDPTSETDATPVTAETVKANSAKAASLLEVALPEIPTDTEERQRIRTQVQQLLAQAHYRAGNLPKAIETLSALVAADETNHTNALLLVNLYLEDGKLTEGKALLEKLPDWAISDPTVYLNVGILFLNKDSAKDAVVYFDKAIALDANKAEGYYYRGLAHL
ncbi:MAG TPA: carboxypeptidase regulatory-like domain-containing protein, partial [Thermoanaerobaculia bacterium]|nr:carboxypeptidase regulatory-like domain-containing protein [Thermoanaerobaculia bacterium]